MNTKRYLSIFLLLFSCFMAFGQDEEFKPYPNGLIYPEATIKHLRQVSDSLNLKYMSCDLDRQYMSFPQGLGNFVSLSGEEVKEAVAFLQRQPDLESFRKNFPEAKIGEQGLYYQQSYCNYKGDSVILFSEFEIENSYGGSLRFDSKTKFPSTTGKGIWIFDQNPEGTELEGIYLPEGLKTVAIPEKYARMIQYVDCMVDTATVVYLEHDEEEGAEFWRNDLSGFSQTELSEILEKMRKTRVYGYCSMDTRPREHARQIARVAAECKDYKVFIRAHLDILNDRFERMTDGSYAWERRQTYLKELEQIDVNTIELLLGMSLRASNTSGNHYNGSIGRMGRAIAEAEQLPALEKQILGMMQDPELDLFNRMVMHNLFLSYLYHDEDEARLASNKLRYKAACKSFPDFLQKQIAMAEY